MEHEEIETIFENYTPRNDQQRRHLIDPVFGWLESSRKRDKFEIARREIHTRFKKMEEGILSHFARYVGGERYVSEDEAWRLACRQREFVRECCARMAESKDGVPSDLSEAIRQIDIGENVKVIPDYSKQVSQQ
ncbi:hypothetical protein RFN29_30430 [Mesorhizobium sp. VK22B]|uniref:Uncharacterized protein n=1 Tax=Mesorhizobium captivum TaxID=3072319 RepID=A0ABU4Z9D5_9HYPH|nr:hypothetical protein [Mesorhizobium sp. VK22B]MDX8495867.1 hypothetical protein [Mesorhizobium sp. VK22B]